MGDYNDSYDPLTHALKQDGYSSSLYDFKSLAGSTQKLVYNDWNTTGQNTQAVNVLFSDTSYDSTYQSALTGYMKSNGMTSQLAAFLALEPSCQQELAYCWQAGSNVLDPNLYNCMADANREKAYDPNVLNSLLQQAKKSSTCTPCVPPNCPDPNRDVEILTYFALILMGLWIVGSKPSSVL